MKKIISYSLWGNNPTYVNGAIENAKLASQIYPGWKCRFYIDRVDVKILEELHDKYGCEVYHVDSSRGSWAGLFWRFYVNDDPEVERYIIRDTDSRLSKREAAAVDEWIKSDLPFHCMKDHPWQSGVPILGAMWGCKTGFIPNMKQLINTWLNNREVPTKGPDQFFLRDSIWPLVKDHRIEHDEVSIPHYRNPNTKPFPTPREDYRFVGEIFDENNKPGGDACHPEHWRILKEFLEGKIC